MPPFDCGLQLIELDAASGRVVRDELIDRGWVGLEQQPLFDGVFRIGTIVLRYDWSTRTQQTLLELPFKPHEFVRAGSRIVAAYADGRVPCIAGYELDANQPMETVRLPRHSTKIKTLWLKSMRHGTLARVNETRLVRLSDDLQPRYEVRVKPYVYDAALTEADVLLIGTDGKGTNLYAFDDRTGAPILHEAQPGHPCFARCGEDWLASYDEKGLSCIRADGARWQHHKTSEPMLVNGVFEDRAWSVPRGPIVQLGLQHVRVAEF